MDDGKPASKQLARELQTIAGEGIRVDRRRLGEDMCTQFADPREWIREFAVNAYDAGASRCWVSGREDGNTLTISVHDNGCGMDRAGVRSFATLFRSVKRANVPALGTHGIGKLSVAAVPGQCGFTMTTSTGHECWRLHAGSLLEDAPIKLEQISPVPDQGTRFEVTFEKRNSVHEELTKLADVLERYLRHLPLRITVFALEGEDPAAPRAAYPLRFLNGAWSPPTELFGREYRFQLNGTGYEAVLGLGKESHEVYQRRVLVTDRYNLLFYDVALDLKVPFLKIRVDSPDLELPFGRHRLRNEGLLKPLAGHLRERILAEYLRELFDLYIRGRLREQDISPMVVQDIACALMRYDSGAERIWSGQPIFSLSGGAQISMVKLKKIAKEKGVLYLEAEKDAGSDPSVFDAPVLALKQPQGGLELIRELFKKELVSLDSEEIVLEAQGDASPQLGPLEERFTRFLGFHPEVLSRVSRSEGGSRVREFHPSPELLHGVTQESRQAEEDLTSLRWRLSYLVHRDGKAPCTTHRFLVRQNTVILNLNHPEIRSLVQLSETAPLFSGHCALALCLDEGEKIFPHLTAEAREDLILLDAMARCGRKGPFERPERTAGKAFTERAWRAFRRNAADTRRWLP